MEPPKAEAAGAEGLAAAAEAPEVQPETEAEGRSRSPQRRGNGEAQRDSSALGHSLREVGPFAFGCKCGSFAKLQGADRAKGLKKQCGGRIPQGTGASAGQRKKRLYLQRLLSRQDPYTGKLL